MPLARRQHGTIYSLTLEFFGAQIGAFRPKSVHTAFISCMLSHIAGPNESSG